MGKKNAPDKSVPKKVASEKTKTKHRKGGNKVRKTAPARRLAATLDKFQRTVAAAKVERGRKEETQLTAVREGTGQAMSGPEYSAYLANTKVTPMAPSKLTRVL